MTRPLRSLILALGLACLALAGCSGGAGHTVELVDNQFQPATLSLSAGEAVHFENKGAHDHTVTIHDPSGHQALDKTLKPGESVDFTFAAKGDYHVFCRFHEAAGMAASVTAA